MLLKIEDINVDELKFEARRTLWMLRRGAREMATQLGVELESQRDMAAEDLHALREELEDWWQADRSVGQRVQDLREFSQDARSLIRRRGRRLGERSADLSRASVAFTRLQALHNDHRGAQCYAPFFLSFHEAKAGMVLALLPAHKRAQMVPLAQKIRDAQLQMGERCSAYRDCAECERPLGDATGGGCCTSSVGQWFRPLDGLFRRLLGERAPMWPRLPRDYTRCGYMGPRGCVLPAGTRPVICVGFYCNDFRGHLDRDGMWAKLGPDFVQIREAIRALDFKFNLHQRFLLRQGNTIEDATMGYLWSKLMKLYAAYDQIAPPTQPQGVDPIGSEDPAEPTTPSADSANADASPATITVLARDTDDETPGLSYDEGIAQVAAMLHNVPSFEKPDGSKN